MRSRCSFWIKVLLAVGLVVLADVALFEVSAPGFGLAVVLTGLVAAVAVANPAAWRNPLGAVALAVAALFAVAQADRPSILATAFVLAGVGVAAISPRARAGDDAWRWAGRLMASTVGVVGPAGRGCAPAALAAMGGQPAAARCAGRHF